MHVIKFKSGSSSSIELFEIELQCENDCFVIHSYELVKLVKELNILFSKITSQISAIAFKEKDSYASDLYEKKLERLNYKDINVASYQNTALIIPYSIVVTIIVFVCCAVIDLLRQILFEKPYMKLVNRYSGKIENVYNKFMEYACYFLD